MKTIVVTIALLVCMSICKAQDYFAVVKKQDNVTYNYPESTVFTLYDADGNAIKIKKGDAVSVKGDYRVEANVIWKDTPEVIKSDGGSLEIFVLEDTYDAPVDRNAKHMTTVYDKSKDYDKPTLEKKTISVSEKDSSKFNGLFVFTNGMVFSYTDGDVRAYQDNSKLYIRGNYLVYGEEDILKISFNPKNAEMWYVFEKNNTK